MDVYCVLYFVNLKVWHICYAPADHPQVKVCDLYGPFTSEEKANEVCKSANEAIRNCDLRRFWD